MPHSENEPESGLGFADVDFGESTKTHKYPLYIDNLNGKNNVPIVQECIHFTAVKQGGISLQKGADESAAIAKAESENEKVFRGSQSFQNLLASYGSKSSSQPDNKTREETNAAIGENDAVIGEKTTKFFGGNDDPTIARKVIAVVGDVISSAIKQAREPAKNLEHCFLYMPASIQFAEGASWGAESLGAMGNLVKQGIRGEGDAGDLMKNFAGGAITELGKAVAIGAGAVAGGALLAIGVATGLGGVGSGLRAAGRFAENPYEEQLFNGISFREFTFEFSFAPASETEGNEVEKIIKMFRFHSRPNFVGGILGEGLYTFPNEFNIEFLKNNSGSFIKNESIPSIYNCVCTNVSTNYSPEGFWVALRDGRPVSYNLSLAFTETKKITQDDVNLGY